MSKHSKGAPRVENDFYPTPYAAALPLLRVLPPRTEFVEPCAGDGALVGHLERHGHTCLDAFDIAPRSFLIDEANALSRVPYEDAPVITNPPFDWKLLQPLLDHWISYTRAWLLLPADMLPNLRFAPYSVYIRHIAPIGRVSWQDNGKAGFDDFSWFYFDLTPQDFIVERKRK